MTEGDAGPPITAATLPRELPGWWLEAECPCGRLTFLPLRLLPGSPIGAIATRLRCRGCHGTPAVWLTDQAGRGTSAYAPAPAVRRISLADLR